MVTYSLNFVFNEMANVPQQQSGFLLRSCPEQRLVFFFSTNLGTMLTSCISWRPCQCCRKLHRLVKALSYKLAVRVEERVSRGVGESERVC